MSRDLTVPDPIAVGSAARESSTARILDRGYRRYDGPRRGRRGAMRSLGIQTMQRSLGIRRSFWSKIFPLLSIAAAYIPAIVFIGMTALFKDKITNSLIDNYLPSYGEYYGFVWAAVLIFVAFVAPEVLCTDRRNGMIGLYLASPLSRDTYLVGKALAVGACLSLVTVGPSLIYLLGLTLNSRGPDGFGGFLTALGQTLLAGFAVAALYVMLSFAVAATTTRRAAASAAIILILLASSLFAETLVTVAGFDSRLLLLDIFFLPFEVVFRIFGEGHVLVAYAELSTPTVLAGYLAWTISFAWFVRHRYQRVAVTR